MIVPNEESLFSLVHEVLDRVAREGRYLAFLQAPAWEDSIAFYRHLANHDLCQFVALDGERVLGWCDILPVTGEARRHVGNLGMGVVAEARHQGVGSQLLAAAMRKARAQGLIRIELTVRTDNQAAVGLYEKFGFVREGLNHKAIRVNDQFYDTFVMAWVDHE
ncbi:MAG: GNAT family N-acetyltransferase [Zoogloea sp.]|uniref:GNAT family N-acetyltransferase n=1 Tax=Zoogloea sp. TaxID=49181 RepID=UPI003F3B7882